MGPSRNQPIPLLSKEGWLRLNKKIRFLSGADGVVSNMPGAAAPYKCRAASSSDLKPSPRALLTIRSTRDTSALWSCWASLPPRC